MIPQDLEKRLKRLEKRLCCAGQNEGNAAVYRAIFQQSGTDDPTPVVLENTVGDIVWTRDNAGLYSGTLTGAFDVNKTFILTSFDPINGIGYFLQSGVVDVNTIYVHNEVFAGGTFVDGAVGFIEIRVYP